MPRVCSAVYGTVHYKELLKSFDKSRLPRYCHDCAESDVIKAIFTHPLTILRLFLVAPFCEYTAFVQFIVTEKYIFENVQNPAPELV